MAGWSESPARARLTEWLAALLAMPKWWRAMIVGAGSVAAVAVILIAVLATRPAPGPVWDYPAEWTRDYEQGKAAFEAEQYEAAIRLLLPLALKGHAPAQTLYGWMQDMGYGVLADKCAATMWYDHAARAGDPEAQFLLAASFNDGKGVQIDAGMAYHWMARSAANGYGSAAEWLDFFEDRAAEDGLLRAAEVLLAQPIEALPPTPFVRFSEELFDWDRNFRDLGYSLYVRFGVGACYFLDPVNEELRKRRHY